MALEVDGRRDEVEGEGIFYMIELSCGRTCSVCLYPYQGVGAKIVGRANKTSSVDKTVNTCGMAVGGGTQSPCRFLVRVVELWIDRTRVALVAVGDACRGRRRRGGRGWRSRGSGAWLALPLCGVVGASSGICNTLLAALQASAVCLLVAPLRCRASLLVERGTWLRLRRQASSFAAPVFDRTLSGDFAKAFVCLTAESVRLDHTGGVLVQARWAGGDVPQDDIRHAGGRGVVQASGGHST
mmetsp:Transcript_34131/g.76843  ORF Transcript_34131/g.76843 Transcript_34131/m.76843 type:complete len:241 (+) Transcript_34131:317-1039(+)